MKGVLAGERTNGRTEMSATIIPTMFAESTTL